MNLPRSPDLKADGITTYAMLALILIHGGGKESFEVGIFLRVRLSRSRFEREVCKNSMALYKWHFEEMTLADDTPELAKRRNDVVIVPDDHLTMQKTMPLALILT